MTKYKNLIIFIGILIFIYGTLVLGMFFLVGRVDDFSTTRFLLYSAISFSVTLVFVDNKEVYFRFIVLVVTSVNLYYVPYLLLHKELSMNNFQSSSACYLAIGYILSVLCLSLHKTAPLKTTLIFLYLSPLLIQAACYLVGNTIFSSDILAVVYQTNIYEIIEYVFDNVSLCMLICFCIATIVLIYYLNKIFSCKLNITVISVITLLCLVAFNGKIIDKKIQESTELNICSEFYKYYNSHKQYVLNADKRKQRISIDNTQIIPGLYVLVIGESLTRDHMSVYGYKRETTPLLNELVQKDSMIWVSKAPI